MRRTHYMGFFCFATLSLSGCGESKIEGQFCEVREAVTTVYDLRYDKNKQGFLDLYESWNGAGFEHKAENVPFTIEDGKLDYRKSIHVGTLNIIDSRTMESSGYTITPCQEI